MAEQYLNQWKMKYGLSSSQVKERVEKKLVNTRVDSLTKSVGQIIKKNIFTYFNLVFLILAILLVLVGAFRDMLFLFVIIANTLIGIVQEIHAKKILDSLSILEMPHLRVFRDNEIMEVSADELVFEDVIVLEAGMQIPADACVLEGEVSVNEALITGEQDEVEKHAKDCLFSGSFVVSGMCIAKLMKVGKESYVAQLTQKATKEKQGEQSEMIRSLDRLILVMGILILPIGIALFVQSYVIKQMNLYDSVTGMVAAVIGMIPEGLYLLATVAMTVGTARLGKSQVLVHDMRCIEALARVDVLCLDKTGTITEPDMQVKEIVFCSSENQWRETETRTLFSMFVAHMPAENETMKALKSYCSYEGGEEPEASGLTIIPFSSKKKYSGMVWKEQVYLLGAPDFLLKEEATVHQRLLMQYATEGNRILMFAEYDGTLEKELVREKVQPLLFVVLYNPLRVGIQDTIAFFRENGVELKVISGDHPETVSAIAQEAGIEKAEKHVDASTLEGEKEFEQAVKEYTVFGRVSPEQKQMLIQTLQKQGKTVAMTGDGVNDVLALRSADCGIAMASGSDAAASASMLVLLDSDFRKMPSIVAEGRRVVNNMQRSASLYIVKNIFSMLLALFSIGFVLEYPLAPIQVSLISMFTIGIPSFCLALEQNRQKIQGHFLSNIFIKAIPAGITNFLVVGGLCFLYQEFGLDSEGLSTSCVILLSVVGILVLFQVAKPIRLRHMILIGVMAFGIIVCMVRAKDFFFFQELTRQKLFLLVLFLFLIEPMHRYLKKMIGGIGWLWKNRHHLGWGKILHITSK